MNAHALLPFTGLAVEPTWHGRYVIFHRPCIEARGSRHCTGYTNQRLHRRVWIKLHGAIPPGVQVDHLCGNRLCIEPTHLRLATPGENVRAAATATYARGVNECRRHGWLNLSQIKRAALATGYVIYQCKLCLTDSQQRLRARRAAGIPGKKYAKRLADLPDLSDRLQHRVDQAEKLRARVRAANLRAASAFTAAQRADRARLAAMQLRLELGDCDDC